MARTCRRFEIGSGNHDCRESGRAVALFRRSGYGDSGRAVAVERQIPRDGDEPPEAATVAGRTSRSRAGAKTRPATIGAPSVISATLRAGTSGRPPISRRCSDRIRTRRRSQRGAQRSAVAITISRRRPTSPFRLTMTSSYGGSALPTALPHAGCSMSRVTRKSCSRPPATDAAQPAFSKLFVETELLRESQAILCSRRPRAPDEPRPWMFHLLTAPEPARGEVSMRRIACASSVAAAPRPIRRRWTTTRHCRGARAPCSIRWPRSAVASRSLLVKPPSSI